MTDSIAEKTLRDAAARIGIVLPPDMAGVLDGFGTRPRLGQIFDHYHPARQKRGRDDIFAVGPYRFLPADYALIHGDKDIRLTEKEAEILSALLHAPAKTIDRKTMLDQIWGYASGVETHTLETHIYRLRQKIEEDPARPTILVTDGDAYRLV